MQKEFSYARVCLNWNATYGVREDYEKLAMHPNEVKRLFLDEAVFEYVEH